MNTKLVEVFECYAGGNFRKPVKKFFSDLALYCTARTGIKNLSLPQFDTSDFSDIELYNLKQVFCRWRDQFTQLNPKTADFLNEIACQLADAEYWQEKNTKELERFVLFGFDDDADANDGEWTPDLSNTLSLEKQKRENKE